MKNRNCLVLLFILNPLLHVFAQKAYESGYLDFENKSYASAIRHFSESIDKREQLSQSYMMRGAALCELKKYTEALVNLDSSIILDSTMYKSYYFKGRIYLLNGFSSLAIKNLNRAISLNSVDSKSFNCRATARMISNDSLGALKDADLAITLDSTNSHFYLNRGFIKSNLLRYTDAILDYNKSLKIMPSQGAYADRGFAFFKLKQYTNAIEDLNKSLEINPNDWEILYYRGLTYLALNRSTEACTDFSRSGQLGGKQALVEFKKNCSAN